MTSLKLMEMILEGESYKTSKGDVVIPSSGKHWIGETVLKNGKAVGKVMDIFGRVSRPYILVRMKKNG